MKTRKTGLFLWFGGAVVLIAAAGMIIAYFAIKSDGGEVLTGLLIGGIIVLIAAFIILIVGYRFAFVPDKSMKQAEEKFLNLSYEKITDYKKELDFIRDGFYGDKNPQKNTFKKRYYVKSEPLYDFNVINKGTVYFGYVVNAAPPLYDVKNMASYVLPAKIVFSTDEYFETNPMELKKIAQKLLSGSASHLLGKNDDWDINVKLPQILTDGKEVFATDIIVSREQLPANCLRDLLVPVVAAPSAFTSAFIVDYKYWSDNFIGNFCHAEARRNKDFSL